METLSPAYITALGTQIGFLSAFLGGFAATFVATILQVEKPGRVAGWAMGLAAVSATAFVVAAVTSTALVAGSHPDAPAMVALSDGLVRARIVSSLCFTLGAYLLLGAIGCSGWLRSRALGWTTSVASVLAGLLVTLSILGF